MGILQLLKTCKNNAKKPPQKQHKAEEQQWQNVVFGGTKRKKREVGHCYQELSEELGAL